MICIFCALTSEMAPLASILGLTQSHHLRNNGSVIAVYEGSDRYFGMVGGMGQQHSIASLEEVARVRSFDEILVVGSAGSLSHAVALNTILWMSTIHHIGKPTLSIDTPISMLTHHNWSSGSLITVDEPVSTATARNQLYDKTHADAVDMESYSIVHWAQTRSMPCNVIRIISDMADVSLQQILQQIKKVMPIMARSLGELLHT